MRSQLFIAVFFLASFASAEECLKYAERVELHGVLSRQTFPEQPNYESIEAGDRAASYFFISPHKSFCVSGGKPPEGLEPKETDITSVQLIFTGNAEASYAALRPYLGQEVVCAGSFEHSVSGHHHTSVFLWEATCSASKPQK